jgi:hypothetical protein
MQDKNSGLPAEYDLSTYLCFHKEKWLSPSVEAFLDMTRAHAKTMEQ